MVGHAIYQVIVLLVLLYVGADIFSVIPRSDQHYTLIFNSFVWCQIFNEFNARKVNGEKNVFEKFWTNYIFMFVIFITILFQTLIVEFGGVAFHTHGLNYYQWLACIGIGAVELIIGLILSFIPVPKDTEYTPPEPGENELLVKGKNKDKEVQFSDQSNIFKEKNKIIDES